MKHLVIGRGEVGRALVEIFKCPSLDIKDGNPLNVLGEPVDFIHISFPYSEKFEENINIYKAAFKHRFMVVHSTVPIGTCKKLGVTHSPIRGKHPDLKESILKFKKFVGGINALAVCKEFAKFDIKCKLVTESDDTEAGKLYDLLQYAVSILTTKHIYKICKKKGLTFDLVYRAFNSTYNEGYAEMEMPEVNRPVLEFKPGKIGGHCVIPMMSLLDDQLARDIISANNSIND